MYTLEACMLVSQLKTFLLKTEKQSMYMQYIPVCHECKVNMRNIYKIIHVMH